MKNEDHTMMQRLIIDLDDSRNLYSHLGRMLFTPHSKDVVEQVVLAHRAIAEDLAGHMCTMGAQTVRRGSTLGKLRVHYGAWRATAATDVELSCLSQIERREASIMDRFLATAEKVRGLQRRLYRHVGELERVSELVTHVLDAVEASSAQVAPGTAGSPGIYPAQAAGALLPAATLP